MNLYVIARRNPQNGLVLITTTSGSQRVFDSIDKTHRAAKELELDREVWTVYLLTEIVGVW